jgi:hypothetical protein
VGCASSDFNSFLANELRKGGRVLVQLLYGLKVDFVKNNGHYMVISATDGLTWERLSSFQVHMLMANPIPLLLPLQVEERDQQIQLYYNISDKRMLTHWLRMDRISLKQFFSLLYAIVDIISQSNIFMLQEGRYMLKEDYIYCGEHITDIHLTYIPIEHLQEKNALSVDLQHLASRLIHKVSELSGNGYQELMGYLMEESFNIPACKKLLQKHRNRLEAEITRPKEGSDVHSNKKINDVQAKSNNIVESKQPAPPIAPPAFSPSWFEEDDQQELNEQNQKFRIPVLLVGVLMLGLVWKLYLDRHGEGWLLICCGLSLFVIDIVFIILKIWKPATKDSESLTWASVHHSLSRERQQTQQVSPLLPFFIPNPDPVEPPSFNEIGSNELKAEAFANSKFESRLDSMGQEATVLKSAASHPVESYRQSMESYYQELEHSTTLLASADATVLLSPSLLQAEMKEVRPYLEYRMDGSRHTIRIDKSPFVIGRRGQGVDYVHEEMGTSRIHAEITIENEQTMFKDLGSRNGSCINGEILVPYRVYNLQEGDIVKLISTEFVFKMGL